VQAWFDSLPEDVKDEIRDLIRHLEKVTDSLWRRPEFDGLRGERDISELRPSDVSVEIGGTIETFTCRIYGFFGPKNQKNDIYTFLHATKKTVRNDRSGKRIARNRLAQLERGNGTIHRFKF